MNQSSTAPGRFLRQSLPGDRFRLATLRGLGKAVGNRLKTHCIFARLQVGLLLPRGKRERRLRRRIVLCSWRQVAWRILCRVLGGGRLPSTSLGLRRVRFPRLSRVGG